MYGDHRRGGSILGSFLLGGLIGAVLGLLFAPRSGVETREMISERANEYWGEANEMYATGKEKVTEAVTVGKEKVTEVVATTKDTAAEKGEELRAKIDEARGRLQEQVAKSAEAAKGKVAETTPVVKESVDKVADATKGGVDVASAKAQDTLDFVAKKAAPAEAAAADVTAPEAPVAGTDTLPQV